MADGPMYHVWAHIEVEAPDGERFHEAEEPEKLVTFTGLDGLERAREYVASLHPFAPLPELVAEIRENLDAIRWGDEGEANRAARDMQTLLERAAAELSRPIEPVRAAPRPIAWDDEAYVPRPEGGS